MAADCEMNVISLLPRRETPLPLIKQKKHVVSEGKWLHIIIFFIFIYFFFNLILFDPPPLRARWEMASREVGKI